MGICDIMFSMHTKEKDVVKKKKVISRETIKSIYKKERRGDIVGYIAVTVIAIVGAVVGVIYAAGALHGALACLCALGMIALLISVARTRKKKKATYVHETEYKIVEAYLARWQSIPGSGEGTWYLHPILAL